MKKGVSYTTVVQIARRYGFVEANHYDQHQNAIRWRAAIRRAVKRGLLRRVKGSTPARTKWVLADDTRRDNAPPSARNLSESS